MENFTSYDEARSLFDIVDKLKDEIQAEQERINDRERALEDREARFRDALDEQEETFKKREEELDDREWRISRKESESSERVDELERTKESLKEEIRKLEKDREDAKRRQSEVLEAVSAEIEQKEKALKQLMEREDLEKNISALIKNADASFKDAARDLRRSAQKIDEKLAESGSGKGAGKEAKRFYEQAENMVRSMEDTSRKLDEALNAISAGDKKTAQAVVAAVDYRLQDVSKECGEAVTEGLGKSAEESKKDLSLAVKSISKDLEDWDLPQETVDELKKPAKFAVCFAILAFAATVANIAVSNGLLGFLGL